MDHMRDARAHDGITLIGYITLPCVVRQEDPVGVPTDFRQEVSVVRVRREVPSMPLDPIPGRFKHIGDAIAEIPVGEKGELMRRTRRRELP